MTGLEIYQRTATYEQEARSIRLHAPHWKLLLAFDGERALTDVAESVDLTLTDALPLTEKFLDHDWIEEQPITLDQYLQRASVVEASPSEPVNTSDSPTLTLPGTPAVEVATPPPIVPPLLTAPVEVTPPPLTQRRPPRLPHGPMRLSAVVDYITSLVGNVALGQILVYRVFLRVPPELLQTEDIVSIHLMGDTSLIRSTSLQQAIANAVKEVANRPLPDGVFAPA